MLWLNSKAFKPALLMLMVSVSDVLAQGQGHHKGGGNSGNGVGNGGPIGAPEIDGPAGVAAIALLVGAGIIAYNRYRKR